MEVLQILKACSVHGNVVKLPEGQLDRKIYQEIAKALTGIGGAWKGGKVLGFVFQSDPTERLLQIQGGEKVNLKKEFQFFATPATLADELVSLAEIKDTDDVLEPSAGQGAIIEAILRANKNCYIKALELMPENAKILHEKNTDNFYQSWEGDFLQESKHARIKGYFDKIIANPPFSKNQDIDHVLAMYECLKVGGRIVSVMSKHWENSANKKETEFRVFLKSVDAEILQVEAGTFKESGTNVPTCIVVINK